MKNKNLRIVLAGLLLGGMYQASYAITVDEGIALIKADNYTELEAQLKEATPLQLYALSGYVDGKIADEWQKVVKKHKVLGFMADLPFDPVFLLTNPGNLLAAVVSVVTAESIIGITVMDIGNVKLALESTTGGAFFGAFSASMYGAQLLIKKNIIRFLASDVMKFLSKSKLLLDNALQQVSSENEGITASFAAITNTSTYPLNEKIVILLVQGNFDEVGSLLARASKDLRIMAQGIIGKMMQQEIATLKNGKKISAFFADKSIVPAVASFVPIFTMNTLLNIKLKDYLEEKVDSVIPSGIGLLNALTIPGIVAYLVYKLPKMIAERQLTNDTIKQLQALKKELTEHHALAKEETHEK